MGIFNKNLLTHYMIYLYRSYQPTSFDQSQYKFQLVIDYLWSLGIDARPIIISKSVPSHLCLRSYPIIELINGQTFCGLSAVIKWIENQTKQQHLISKAINWSKEHSDFQTPEIKAVERIHQITQKHNL